MPRRKPSVQVISLWQQPEDFFFITRTAVWTKLTSWINHKVNVKASTGSMWDHTSVTFFIISVSHHFIVSFLTFTFLITPPFLSSCVPFSDFKQCQASVVWVNREVSLSLSLCAMVKCHTRAGIESPVGMKWALHQCDKRWSCFCVKKRWFMC